MHKVVEFISFVIWIIYFGLLTSREICHKNKNKEKYNWNLIKKNIFYLFRLDSLFFLIMFYIYKGFNNESVTVYLYFVFVVSALVFIFYDLNDKYDLRKIKFKKEKIFYLVSLLLMIQPIIYYKITHNIANAYVYTLVLNFLVPIVIYLVKIIKKNIDK